MRVIWFDDVVSSHANVILAYHWQSTGLKLSTSVPLSLASSRPLSPLTPLPSPLMNSWMHCPGSRALLFLSCSLPLFPVLYNWLSCSLCDIIASLPGRMTFHRLWATIKLIVLEREGESSVYVCAADDKRRAVAPFVLYRPTEGWKWHLSPHWASNPSWPDVLSPSPALSQSYLVSFISLYFLNSFLIIFVGTYLL